MAPALLRDSIKTEHELQLLDLIEQGARRGANIVRQLLTFSRGTGGERVNLQLRHLLKEMSDIMRETFPRNIAIVHHAARDLRPVVGDATQMHQVLMNLCVNARDAMPEGGKLTLSAKNVELDAAAVRAHPAAKPGPHVALNVADTGCGIPPKVIGHVFEPFFTTKLPGKGTGLGLSVVLGIIRSHGGFITVASEPGEGTTFSIFLPVAPDDGEAAPSGDTDELPGGDGELILVVDDEASIRIGTRLMLERHGYRVLTANEGSEALAIILKNREAVRVVFTDVMMPMMGGLDLIKRLRAAHPGVKVIAMSGLSDQANHDALLAAGADCILAKPWGRRELLLAIRSQLSAPA
jgi:CheY-like chemotaxis protein